MTTTISPSAAIRPRPAIERRHPPKALMRLVNPLMRRLLGSRWHRRLSQALLVLHFHGRRSGRHYDVVAGHHHIGDRFGVMTNSPWRHNFADGRDIEVTYLGRRRPARATLIEDPETVADLYRDVIEEVGVDQAQRRLGIKINVDRTPTRDELLDAVRREGLSFVELELR